MSGEIERWADSGMDDVLIGLLAADENDDEDQKIIVSQLWSVPSTFHAKLMGQRQTRGLFADL